VTVSRLADRAHPAHSGSTTAAPTVVGMADTRATGRRRIVGVTSAIAGAALVGSVGIALVASHSEASATTSTSTASDGTGSSDTGSGGWAPSTSGVTHGSGSGSHATSGGS
jgi:hypothetical protein